MIQPSSRGGSGYKLDLPDAEVYLLDAGHFALRRTAGKSRIESGTFLERQLSYDSRVVVKRRVCPYHQRTPLTAKDCLMPPRDAVSPRIATLCTSSTVTQPRSAPVICCSFPVRSEVVLTVHPNPNSRRRFGWRSPICKRRLRQEGALSMTLST